MKEIDMDLHDEESSFDTKKEELDLDFENFFDRSSDDSETERELVFYRRLEDY